MNPEELRRFYDELLELGLGCTELQTLYYYSLMARDKLALIRNQLSLAKHEVDRIVEILGQRYEYMQRDVDDAMHRAHSVSDWADHLANAALLLMHEKGCLEEAIRVLKSIAGR